MRGVLEAGKNVDVAVISKVHSLRSHSGAAQGGIATVLDGWAQKIGDSLESHIRTLSKVVIILVTMMDRDSTLDLKDMKNIPMKTMYHYPCHIRASDLDESIYVNLITKIPGIELVQVPSSGLCCGGGGGVRAAYPDISDKLAIRRMEIARDEGVDGLLTNCPFCILSFERGLGLKEEAGEAMDFGIFDFYKIFSRAFGEDEMITEGY